MRGNQGTARVSGGHGKLATARATAAVHPKTFCAKADVPPMAEDLPAHGHSAEYAMILQKRVITDSLHEWIISTSSP
jgi:hypothetical protein